MGIVRQRRRGLKWGFLALRSAASARQLRRVDAEALHQHYSNTLARRLLSNWNEHSRLSIGLRENIHQSLSEREIPHHPLRWVITRLKKQLLVRTKHKRVRANDISIRHLARNGLRNMWQHMQEVQRARMEEERAFHHFSQKAAFPVFVNFLVHARRRKRAQQKKELYLHAMDRHRMTKTLAQWHGNATVLAQRHRAQAFGDRRLMKRVWAGLTKYTEMSTDMHIHEQAVVNFSASTRLVRSWKQWTLLFKVLRCAKTLQKKRTISRLSLRILQKKKVQAIHCQRSADPAQHRAAPARTAVLGAHGSVGAGCTPSGGQARPACLARFVRSAAGVEAGSGAPRREEGPDGSGGGVEGVVCSAAGVDGKAETASQCGRALPCIGSQVRFPKTCCPLSAQQGVNTLGFDHGNLCRAGWL